MIAISKNKKIRVAFIIATLGHGRGGHFWDLKTIIQALNNYVKCVVINIGCFNSPVLNSMSVPVFNIRFTGFDFIKTIRSVIIVLRKQGVDVINLFDTRVFCFADISCRLLKKPLIITKCGGPNPGLMYPIVDTMIIFSKENLEYFLRKDRYKRTKLYFLPNRVAIQTPDFERIEKLKSFINPNKKIFLMISRFCDYYKANILQAIHLIQRLNKDNHLCNLVVIGAPEQISLVDEITNNYCSDNIIIIKDDEFTIESSRLIDVADFVIASGRGFMEAASYGKVLLTYLADSPFPLLITQETFNRVFYYNFSPRNKIEDFDTEENYKKICMAIDKRSFYIKLECISKNLFDEHFNVCKVVEKYRDIFHNTHYKKRNSYFKLLYWIFTTVIMFYNTKRSKD